MVQGITLARSRVVVATRSAVDSNFKPSAHSPMQVRDVMTKDPACVTPGATIREAAQLMQRENVGIVPVVEEKGTKRLLGVVTDRDIAIRVVAEGRDGGTRVSDVMSSGRIRT